MRYRRGRRVRQLALVMVAAPAAARRAEERDKTSPTSRRLRQGADLVQRFGRGPLDGPAVCGRPDIAIQEGAAGTPNLSGSQR
jgi:hypothetical protein